MMARFMLLALAGLILISPGAAQTAPPTERFPILAWYGPPADHTTVERYRELAECGFTITLSDFPDLEAVAKGLDVGKQTGIGVLITVPDLRSKPALVAARFRDHPANAGYHVSDEPHVKQFKKVAKSVREIQAVDFRNGCYVNLFGNQAERGDFGLKSYAKYLDRFVAQVPVPYISFDQYPILHKGLRPGFYENLELVSRKARLVNKPFWAFALSIGHDPYPVPTLGHLRFQVNSNLAYGAQCIQYFTYWGLGGGGTKRNYRESPIDQTGRRTPTYNLVAQVNREVHALAPVFRNARVVETGHTGLLPAGTTAFRAISPVASVQASGPGVLFSRLEKGSRRYLVVVNRDYQAPQDVIVQLDSSARAEEILKTGAPKPIQGGRVVSNLAAGDALVLSLSPGS